MSKTYRIFLCYAREDFDKVKQLYDDLSNAGFTPWMDKEGILPGEKWDRAILKALRHSDFFFACLSKNSTNKRGFLQREIKRALHYWEEKLEDDIYLIPVRLEECAAPSSLQDFQWVDLFENDGWAKLMKALNESIKRHEDSQNIQTSSFGKLNIKTEKIHESGLPSSNYEIDAEFPQIEAESSNSLNEINYILRGFIAETIQEFRKQFSTPIPESQSQIQFESTNPSTLDITYTITQFNENIFSLMFTIGWYGSGAAHPNSWTKVFNFQFNPLLPIELQDLFEADSNYLEFISNYCLENLKKQAQNDDYDLYNQSTINWLDNLEPQVKNFCKFTIDEGALIFLFDPYEVGPYAWGTRSVSIPYDQMKSILIPNSCITSLTKG